MAFLLTYGHSIYYHPLAKQHIQACFPMHNLYYHAHSHHDLSQILPQLIQQENNGIIIYSQEVLGELECVLSHIAQTPILIQPQKTTLNIQGNCLEFYPEALALNMPKSAQEVWIYPLGFDQATSLLFLEPLCHTHAITLIPVAHTQAHIAFLAQANNPSSLAAFVQNVIEHFGLRFFITYDIAQSIQDLLKEQNKTVSVAESCTGGLIASILTSYPNASAILKGSVIAYSDSIKHSWLEVPQVLLQSYGSVSEVVAKSMAQGIMKLSKAQYAIATTGLAGPSGDEHNRYPVGTVFIAVLSEEREDIQQLFFQGDRHYIQQQASHYALFMLLKMILGV